MADSTADKSSYAQYFSVVHHYHHLRFQWIADTFLSGIKDQRIAEIGAGDGGVIQFLKEQNDVTGLDISQTGIDHLASLGIDAALVDLSSEPLPFADHQLDLFMMFEVFEHLKNPQQAVEEIQRVVKPGGRVLLSIPNPRTGHPYLYPALFRFNAFKQYLKNNGFTIRRITPYGVTPPLWPILKPLVFNKKRRDLEDKPLTKNAAQDTRSNYPLTTRLNRWSSSPFWTAIKPKRYAWLCVYDLVNDDPKGSRTLFDRVAFRESHEAAVHKD